MREKIIVVEDEFYINDILTTALEEEKFQVLSLFNGESLKKNLMDFVPDIVLLILFGVMSILEKIEQLMFI